MTSALNERTYSLVEELKKIATAQESSVARIALAWVRMRAGATSTIIGARRVSELEDNLKSLDITLSDEQLAHLDGLTTPAMPFPQRLQPFFPVFQNGATTINGVTARPSPIIKPGVAPY